MVTMLNISTKFERTALDWVEIDLITDVHALNQNSLHRILITTVLTVIFWVSLTLLFHTDKHYFWGQHYLGILWVGLIVTYLKFNISL